MAMTIIMSIFLFACLWIVCCIILLWAFYRAELQKILIEPMLRYPVIIFESDDWGPGPLKQETALEQIIQLFARFSDKQGRHPVMTLGMILAEPDTDKIIAAEGKKYYQRTLADSRYTDILKVIKLGAEQGVYAVQLHGMEHFWPESILQSIDSQPQVEQWLFNSNDKLTEDLPSELQSRWVDCSSLPSKEHSQKAINNAINKEISLFTHLFGKQPSVVVPPTFVWTNWVAQVYAKHSINTLITPGRQGVGRDTNDIIYNKKTFFNGQKSSDGLLFLVRNNYFEPSLGHKAPTALKAIHQKVNCARPALLEMHRFNFINRPEDCTASLQELEILLKLILSELPDVRFISTEQLATIIRESSQTKDSEFMISSLLQRFKVAVSRIKLFLEFKRFAKYSGINLLLKLC